MCVCVHESMAVFMGYAVERERYSLLFICLVRVGKVVKELSIHGHHRLEYVVDQSNDGPVATQWGKNYYTN